VEQRKRRLANFEGVPIRHPVMPRLSASSFLAACTAAATALAVLGCTDGSREQPRGAGVPPLVVRDSIRMRREARLAVRPDTFGARVDSARVLRAAVDANSVPWVVIVSDFECEECRRLAVDVVAPLRRELEESRAANLAFLGFPQDDHFNARFAAHAALCAAASGRFWVMHDSLFATMPLWRRSPDPRPYFDSLAVTLGANGEVQRDCTRRSRLLRLLDTDIELSLKSGAREVPVVFVGDRRLARGELTLDGVRRAIAATPR